MELSPKERKVLIVPIRHYLETMTFYEADKSLTEQFIQINKTLRKLFLKIAKEEGVKISEVDALFMGIEKLVSEKTLEESMSFSEKEDYRLLKVAKYFYIKRKESKK